MPMLTINMGLALYRPQARRRGSGSFNKAIDNSLDDAFVYHHKGLALYRLNRRDEALQAYGELLLEQEPRTWSILTSIKAMCSGTSMRHEEGRSSL